MTTLSEVDKRGIRADLLPLMELGKNNQQKFGSVENEIQDKRKELADRVKTLEAEIVMVDNLLADVQTNKQKAVLTSKKNKAASKLEQAKAKLAAVSIKVEEASKVKAQAYEALHRVVDTYIKSLGLPD